MTAPMHLPQFFVKQKLTMMVNRYEINEANPDGTVGRLMAVAQQKRMAFKEQVTFYRDDKRTEPVFSFQARQVMDMGAGYDVRDGSGSPLGMFRKDFGQSLLRSTFHLSGPGLEATGQERNQVVAVLRRFVDFPFAFHFDFKDQQTGTVVMSSERQMSLRDRYVVTVPDPRLDFRLAASMAVGLDALLAR
ncbi:MAG: hypothetical protein JWR85_2155 [Marmoricola sp.]|nr:hypothetical protein [Marmoricola sp.]